MVATAYVQERRSTHLYASSDHPPLKCSRNVFAAAHRIDIGGAPTGGLTDREMGADLRFSEEED